MDARRREVAAGELIFAEGEPGDNAYIIMSGSVEILKNAGDRDIVIATVAAGSFLGEMAIIDDAPRMAGARAATDTVLTVIARDELNVRLERLEKFDPVMRRLMGMFVQRMRDFRFISADT
jgi:CRP-like cAMP-binding protein